MVAYLDDIVIYSNSMEEHVEHLRTVFRVLRENELFVKREKCTFATEEVQFLGHVIGHGKLKMDEPKVKAIMEWEAPTKVTELRSILVKGFRLYSFQLPDSKSPVLLFIVTTSPCQDWVICAPAAFLGCGSRLSGSLSGIEP